MYIYGKTILSKGEMAYHAKNNDEWKLLWIVMNPHCVLAHQPNRPVRALAMSISISTELLGVVYLRPFVSKSSVILSNNSTKLWSAKKISLVVVTVSSAIRFPSPSILEL